MQSTPESGARAAYDGDKTCKGSKIHIAVNTLGHLLARHAHRRAETQPGCYPDRANAASDWRVNRDLVCRPRLHG
jgi:hypothetical protein